MAVQISKSIVYVVLSPVRAGVGVAKGLVHATLSPKGLAVAKGVVHTVLAPKDLAIAKGITHVVLQQQAPAVSIAKSIVYVTLKRLDVDEPQVIMLMT